MLVGRYFSVRSWLLITLIKCLKGHKSLGSHCSVVKTLIVSGAGPSKGPRGKVTYWTAKKDLQGCLFCPGVKNWFSAEVAFS